MSLLQSRARALAPGVGIALVVAAAATFLSEHYTAPVMLYALLLGMALSFLTEDGRMGAGLEFASKALLRAGVALLGMRIAWDQVTSVGWGPVLMVVALVGITISISIVLARIMGFHPLFDFFRVEPQRFAGHPQRWPCLPRCLRMRRRIRRPSLPSLAFRSFLHWQ